MMLAVVQSGYFSQIPFNSRHGSGAFNVPFLLDYKTVHAISEKMNLPNYTLKNLS